MRRVILCAIAACFAVAALAQPTAEQLNELKKYVYPLRTAVPDGGDDSDLEVLKTLLGDASMVALGEATHGTREIFQMKDRLVRYMAQNMGFDIFSIEANMPEAYAVNNYTVRGEGTAEQWIGGSGMFYIWRTEEVRDMVEWMRSYNGGQKKIEFTGFDMQNGFSALHELLKVFPEDSTLLSVGDNLNAMFSSKVDTIRRSNISGEVARIRKGIGGARLMALPDSTRRWAMQMVSILEQSLDKTAVNMSGAPNAQGIGIMVRDFHMAQNVGWIKETNPGSKIALWAHNAHVNDAGYLMGAHLKNAFHDDYLTVGFALGEGTYTARKQGLTYTADNVLATPPADSYEHILGQLDGDILLVDLRRIKHENGGEMDWFLQPRKFRHIGEMATPMQFSQPTEIANAFDYLIFIRNSTASRLLQVSQNN
jgi:erythromycin esterase